jgi:hypothetical protein
MNVKSTIKDKSMIPRQTVLTIENDPVKELIGEWQVVFISLAMVAMIKLWF